MHECDYFMWGGSGGPRPENFEKPTLKQRILRLLWPPRVGKGVEGGGGAMDFNIRFSQIARMVQLSSKKPESLKSLKKADPCLC